MAHHPHQSPAQQPQAVQGAQAAVASSHSLQHGAIGLAAVAAAAQQIRPKAVKRPEHPLPACLREQD